MKNLLLWKKISRVSIIACGVVTLTSIVFDKYLVNHNTLMIVLLTVTLAMVLFSELMKYISKKP